MKINTLKNDLFYIQKMRLSWSKIDKIENFMKFNLKINKFI